MGDAGGYCQGPGSPFGRPRRPYSFWPTCGLRALRFARIVPSNPAAQGSDQIEVTLALLAPTPFTSGDGGAELLVDLEGSLAELVGLEIPSELLHHLPGGCQVGTECTEQPCFP